MKKTLKEELEESFQRWDNEPVSYTHLRAHET